MKKLALGALVALFAACGGGSDKPMLIDSLMTGSDVDATPPTCNPVAQTGCAASEKCTWIIDQDGSANADDIAHIGCAPNGTVAVDAACTAATSTANDGHDNCLGGSYCLGGSCQKICDLQNAASCDSDHSCARYSNVFESGGNAVAGVCDPQCDPLSQALKAGANPAACGSPSPAAPNKGCFSGNIVTFTCSPTGTTHYTKTDRVAAAETNGTVYINSCAPGYLALFYQDSVSMTVICDGLCAPLETDNTAALMNNGKGDGTVLGKQPTDPAPVAGHAKCTPFAAGGKGSVAAEECRFMWTLLFDMAGNPVESQYKDSLGYCYAYSQYKYDPTQGTNPTTPKPACASLPPASATTTGADDDAKDWGCYNSVDNAFDGHPVKPKMMQDVRLGYGAATLTRHTIE